MSSQWIGSWCVCAALLLSHGTMVHAQVRGGTDPTGVQLTRTQLEESLARYEAAANASSGSTRAQAQAEAALIRERLEQGDFRVGDQIALTVDGYTELTDTFHVSAGRVLRLPQIGEVPLAGVLRSELQPHLSTHIGRYIREPSVHARSLIRLHIYGAVGRPGFYDLPSDILLTQALMLAGGPSNAALERIRIERGRETVWRGEPIRQALQEGWTLDQLNIRAGDAINVPMQGSRFSVVRNVLIGMSTVLSILYFARQIGLL